MVNVFVGEFLFHPCPLEISGNTCSHNCIYCFANIRKTKRECKLSSTLNFLKTYSDKTYMKSLLNEGYPVCFSNKSDPFSKNNYIQTLSIFEHLMQRKNGVFIQTKGGYGIDQALQIIGERRNVVWYITVTTLKEDILAKIEPNAPPTHERLELAEKLHKMGFMVIIAFNPLVEDWMPMSDVETICDRLKHAGIKHIIHEPLHLNQREVETYPQSIKDRYGEKVLADACDLRRNVQYSRNMTIYLKDNGFIPFKLAMPYTTELFNDIRERLGLIFPNQWDFINHVFEISNGKPREITFDDYETAITKYNKDFFYKPFVGAQMYMIRHAFNQWKGNDDVQAENTLIGVMRFHWNTKQCRTSMQNNALFKKVTVNGSDKLDKNGNIILYFDGTIDPSYFDGTIKNIKRVHELIC
jgi:DNA repair photolyase